MARLITRWIIYWQIGDDIRVRSCRGTDCNTDHYLMDAKVTERLAVNKKAQTFNVERFNLRKLNELEVIKQYQLRSQAGFQLWRT